MKTLLENWSKYLKEEIEEDQKIYYWQAKGEWRGDKPIEYGVTHVPQAIPLTRSAGNIEYPSKYSLEELLEMGRLEADPSLPSRLSCAYICDIIQKGWWEDEISKKSFCRCGSKSLVTYKVIIKPGAKTYKANAYWLSNIIEFYKNDKDRLEAAKFYWKGIHPQERNPAPEILVSPPSSVIIVGKLEGC